MNDTINYYNKNAEKFIEETLHADMCYCRSRFLRHVLPGGRILDAGCGSGRDSLAFLQEGYLVDAFDASEEICIRASKLLGFPVECKRFEDISGEAKYDGIWACASLLHVKNEGLLIVLCKLEKLLKSGGVLYASFKEGNKERIKEGRFFHDMTEQSCRELFTKVGLEVVETFKSWDVRGNRTNEKWVNIIGKRQ